MTFENFKKLLDAYRNKEEFIDTLENVGVDIFDSKIIDDFNTVFSICLGESYNEEGFDWVYWYLNELSDVKILKEKDNDDTPYASDKDGNPISLETDEELYNFLEKICK